MFNEIVAMIKSYYINHTTAKSIATSLMNNLNRGVYDNISDMKTFAKVLTNDLQNFSRDKHFRLVFGVHPAEPSELEQHHRLVNLNYGFGEINVFGTIACVGIDGFVPVHWVGVRKKIAEVISTMAKADGLILDLRRNRGGDPATVA